MKSKPFLIAALVFGGIGFLVLLLTVISFFCGDNLISAAVGGIMRLDKESFNDATMGQIAVVFCIPAFIFAFRAFADNDAVPVVNQPGKQEPAESEPAESEPAESEPAESEPAESEPAESEPAESEPAENEPAENEPAENEPAESEPAENESAENEPTENESASRQEETAAETDIRLAEISEMPDNVPAAVSEQ